MLTAESITEARLRAEAADLDGQLNFEVASAHSFTGGPYDLVTTFDALHDMGDPLGAARSRPQRVNRERDVDGRRARCRSLGGRQPQPGRPRGRRQCPHEASPAPATALLPAIARAAGLGGAMSRDRSREAFSVTSRQRGCRCPGVWRR